MRIGIYGGTFDPVHLGHLLLAECCREELSLDEVWFLPAASAPHKKNVVASARQRVEMLELAIAGNESFRISTLEIDRGGVSYTVDTLAELRTKLPGDELFLLLGGDMGIDFPNWRDPARICELSWPVFVQRADFADPNWHDVGKFVSAEKLAWLKANRVAMPLIQVSSSGLRQRVAAQQGIRFRTTRAVEEYIFGQGLYREP